MAACGGIYRAEQGQFSSPGYPVSYDHNLNCDYRIMAKPTDFITVRFEEPFDMEKSKYFHMYCF